MEKGRQSTERAREILVEAVARAIEAARHDYESQDWGLSDRDLKIARAAIAAMPSIPQESDAEVTEAMESAGAHIIAMSSYAIIQKMPRGLAKHIYTAMTSARDRRG